MLKASLTKNTVTTNSDTQIFVFQIEPKTSSRPTTDVYVQYQDLVFKTSPEDLEQKLIVFVDYLAEAGRAVGNEYPDWFEILANDSQSDRSSRAFLIKQAELANEKLKQLPEEKNEVKIWNGPSADKEDAKQGTDTAVDVSRKDSSFCQLERDFTVAGTPSKLGCPFSKVNGIQTLNNGGLSITTPISSRSRLSPSALRSPARRSHRQSFNDPIRAELHGSTVDAASAQPSVEGSAGVCPMRFLDQHNPEDVANYFEKHKHELPRSHEICIKRFQTNSDQVRQLDAKYGNMVTMIQGLGHKHQPMFPDAPAEDDEVFLEDESSGRVKNWAEGVSASLQEGEPGLPADEVNVPIEVEQEETREAHFDRPMKEVRVGESPSRPWGITVPAKYHKTASDLRPHSPATAAPPEMHMPTSTVRPSGCPFDHTKLQAQVSDMPDFHTSKPAPVPLPEDTNPPSKDVPNTPSAGEAPKSPIPNAQMVFNGPVFFGYAPEQVQQFLTQCIGKSN